MQSTIHKVLTMQSSKDISTWEQNSAYALIDFSKKDAAFLPPFQAVTQMQMATRQPGAYQLQNENANLVTAFQQFLQQHVGQHFIAENVQLMNEMQQSILQLSHAFLHPGDKVLCPNPGEPLYADAAKLLAADVVFYEGNTFDTLEDTTDLNQVKLIWIENPQFPTGKSIPIHQLKKLIQLAKKHDFLILNINNNPCYLHAFPKSIFEVASTNDPVLEYISLAKLFHVGGWQIGCVYGNKTYLAPIALLRKHFFTAGFYALQEGAIRALTLESDWLEEQDLQYQNRLEKLTTLSKVMQTEIQPDASGTFRWLKIPNDFASSEAFSRQLLKKYSIFVTPGNWFGKAGEGYVLVSLQVSEANIMQAIYRVQPNEG